MAEGMGGQERTERPTPKRRQKARDEGQVARSPELSSAVVVLAGGLMLATAAGASFSELGRRLLVESTSAISFRELGPQGGLGFLRLAAGSFLGAFALFGLGVCALSVLVNAVQAKGVLSLKPITPDWSKASPVSGIKRIFSRESVFTGVKAVLKLGAIGLVTWFVLSRSLPEVISLSQTSPADVAAVLRRLLIRMAAVLTFAYLIVAAIDYVWQHFRLERQLKMSRQEIVHENKDTEGDPHVKARIQAMGRALARRRMLQRVPEADVVVVNPIHVAVALKYDVEEAAAPVVLAMGQRKLAERIKALARRHDVAVVENVAVARALLATAKVGKPIPPALYAAVAEILAFVYRRRGSAPAVPGLPEPGRIVT